MEAARKTRCFGAVGRILNWLMLSWCMKSIISVPAITGSKDHLFPLWNTCQCLLSCNYGGMSLSFLDCKFAFEPRYNGLHGRSRILLPTRRCKPICLDVVLICPSHEVPGFSLSYCLRGVSNMQLIAGLLANSWKSGAVIKHSAKVLMSVCQVHGIFLIETMSYYTSSAVV